MFPESQSDVATLLLYTYGRKKGKIWGGESWPAPPRYFPTFFPVKRCWGKKESAFFERGRKKVGKTTSLENGGFLRVAEKTIVLLLPSPLDRKIGEV